ncbi:hypothetical protein [Streptomyces mirabilis]|uniref:hypothetical protein n=1 Tax=Streptomyces mirabilis TaxID=68239 RepID=UPI003333AB28
MEPRSAGRSRIYTRSGSRPRPKADPRDKEIARLEAELGKARTVIEVHGNLSALLDRGVVGRVGACAALGVSRATYYRHHRTSPPPARAPRRQRRRHPRALTPAEETRVLEVLRSQEFVDMTPAEIYAVLLERGVHLCSESTMYRIPRRHGEVRERRRQASHRPRKKPELVAQGPKRVWSWDIKLKGPVKGSYCGCGCR